MSIQLNSWKLLELVVFLMQMVRWMTNDEKADEDSEDMMK